MSLQALTDTQMKQMKSDLWARLKKVISKYFEERNENATVKDLESFINTSIRYEYMKHENNCFTVRISAKPNATLKIVYNDAIGGGVTRVCAAVGSFFGSTGGPLVAVAGAAGGAAAGAVAGVFAGAAAKVVKSMVGGGGVRDYKDSFSAEEIFRLLETDGFEKKDEWVKCTVKLT